MKNILKIVSIFILVVALSANLHAAKRYWIASSGAYWNNAANWSASSGGSGGVSVPASSDTAYFDGNGSGNDTIDVNVNIKRLEISGAFTGKLIQRTYTITIGTGGAMLAGGIFSGGSAAISVAGAFIISGTAFTSTSATMTLDNNYTLSGGSFTHNNGKVTFSATCTITGSSTFYQLAFAPVSTTGIFTLASGTNLTANGNFSYEGSQGIRIDGDTIKAKANIYLNNSTYYTNPGNATISISSASGNQTLNGAASTMLSNPVNICIVKGAADTLFLNGYISSNRDWKLVSGVLVSGSSTLYLFNYTYLGGPTITGTQSLNNLTLDVQSDLSVYTIATSTILTVNGTFNIVGYGYARINNGTLYAKGNISIGNGNVGGGGTGTIVINGTGNQSLSGSTGLAIGGLCNVEINKASGTLTLSNYITVMGNWTYTAGTLNAGTSTVYFFGNVLITGTQSLYNVRFWGGNVSYIVASGSILTITGTLSTDGVGICNLYLGIIHAQGDINFSNTYTANFGLANLVINGTGNQTFTCGSTYATTGRLPNIEINKPSGTLTLVGVFSLYGDWTYTAGTINPGSSTVYFAGNVYGSHTLNNAVIRDGLNLSMGSGITITLNGSLTYASGGSGLGNGFYYGTFDVKGNVIVNNTYAATIYGGIGTLKLSGTGNQSITGCGVTGSGKLPNINIDKTSGTLSLSSVISVAGDWIYTQGTVNPGTSTVVLLNTTNLDGQAAGSSNTMSFNSLGIVGTVTLTGNIDVNNTLSIGNGATLSAGSNSIYVGGNWNNTTGTWTYGTSTVIFDGSTYKQIKRTSSGTPATETFYNLSFNRNTGSQTLASPVVVNNVLTLTKGHVKTTTTNYLSLIDGATLVGGSDIAYVHGPVRKTGDDAFVFPLGDTTLNDSSAYHPLGMTAPAVNTDQFEACYFALNQTYGDSLVDSLSAISSCEYWTLQRKAGTSAPVVSVSWNKNSCNVDDYSDLKVAQWDGIKWLDLGATSVSVVDYIGIVTASVTPSFTVTPVPILIGRGGRSYEYAVLKKKLDGGYYQAINGRLFFRYDEEYNDADGYLTFNIYADNAERITTPIPITSNTSLPLALRPHVAYGDNRYRLNTIQCNFANDGGTLPNGFYILEVINEKNERWYLRFKNYSTIAVVCGPQPG